MHNNKEQLLALQKVFNNRIVKIDKDLHSRLSSAKFSEQAVDHQNDDVILNLKNEAQQELEQVNHALLKIERDVYGTCEKCHSVISTERLDAIPFTAYCKNCAV
jgi:DnaK suppressor protein